MVSKSSLLPLIRAYDWRGVDAALGERPDLLAYRDDRQRNWLHLLCMSPLGRRDPKDSIRTADVLLARGIKLSEHAFTEGKWKATPVWHCVARGRNLVLAEHLLRLGADPNYSFFAAAWNHDIEAIDLLARYGGDIEDRCNPFETPFIGAIAWRRLDAAKALARHGANVNAVDRKGRTALHILLKKGRSTTRLPKSWRSGVASTSPTLLAARRRKSWRARGISDSVRWRRHSPTSIVSGLRQGLAASRRGGQTAPRRQATTRTSVPAAPAKNP